MGARFVRLVTAVSASLLAIGSACSRSTDVVPRADPSVITQEQIAENHFTTAYQAVESLRSNWLLTKGPDSFKTPSQVRVYMDNSFVGGVETLRDITTRTVAYIKHYDGIAATGRWGLDHGAGVIYVSSRAATTDPQ
jgi:hypothetical protein